MPKPFSEHKMYGSRIFGDRLGFSLIRFHSFTQPFQCTKVIQSSHQRLFNLDVSPCPAQCDKILPITACKFVHGYEPHGVQKGLNHGLINIQIPKRMSASLLKSLQEVFSGNSLPGSRPYFVCCFLGVVKSHVDSDSSRYCKD